MREYAPVIESATAGEVRAETLYPGVDWLRDAHGSVTGYVVHLTPAGESDEQPQQRGEVSMEAANG